jgi:hypothetical protein
VKFNLQCGVDGWQLPGVAEAVVAEFAPDKTAIGAEVGVLALRTVFVRRHVLAAVCALAEHLSAVFADHDLGFLEDGLGQFPFMFEDCLQILEKAGVAFIQLLLLPEQASLDECPHSPFPIDIRKLF